MQKSEEIREGVRHCVEISQCDGCPYHSGKYDCVRELLRDTYKEYTESKPKEVDVDIDGGGAWYFAVCDECRTIVSESDKYCKECGGKLRWNTKR